MSQNWQPGQYNPYNQPPPPPAPPPPPPPAPPPVPDGKMGMGCAIAGLGCGGITVFFVTLLLLVFFVAELGPLIFVVALFMAFLPAVVYTTIVLLIDRFDPEPPWVLFLAFVWGAVISVFGALIINTTGSAIAGEIGGAGAAEFFGAVISAPFVEEGMKGLGLLIVLLALRKEFDGIVDGIVYACMIALGFATVENVLYYGRNLGAGGLPGGVVVFFIRGIMSPFAHPLFTSMTGIGCGIAREQKKGVLVWIAPILGYFVAVLLHATWNGVPTIAGALFGEAGGLLFILTFLVGWIPAFLCFVVAIAYCLNRERKIIKTFLTEEMQLGVITPDEFALVLSPYRRFSFLMQHLRSGGFSGYRTARTFTRTATRLALSKWHTLNASKKQAETRSLGMIPVLRQELVALRAALGQ